MVVLRAKCILIGDCTVGKTAISQALSSDGTMFPKNYLMTTGIELSQKLIAMPSKSDYVDFFLFDCAGKSVFSDVCKKHWNEMGMVAVVFDVTSLESLDNCKKWLHEIQPLMKKSKTIPGVLIGNKADLDQRRQVTEEDAQEVARELKMEYFECSAKANEGIEIPFKHLGEKFHEIYNESPESLQLVK